MTPRVRSAVARGVAAAVVVLWGLVATNRPVAALQVTTVVPFPVACGEAAVPWVEFRKAYLRGQMAEASDLIWSRLKDTPLTSKPGQCGTGDGPAVKLDFEKHYYFVIVPVSYDGISAEQQASSTTRLARVLVHDPSPHTFERLLPNADGDAVKVYEIVFPHVLGVTKDTSDTPSPPWFASTYTYERTADPLATTLPAFLKTYLSVEWLLQFVAVEDDRSPFVLREVPVPASRAKVSVSDQFSLGDGDTIDANDVYYVEPDSRLTLGVLVGAAFESGGKRLKLEDGTIRTDPIPRGLAMGVANWHPLGFQPKASDLTWGWHPFLGVIVSPEPGLAVGIGHGPPRRLSLNLGLGAMMVDALKPGDRVGDAPSDPEEPFRAGFATVWFVGLAFAFQPG